MAEDESIGVDGVVIMVETRMPPGILQVENKERCRREAQRIINRESFEVAFQNCP